MGRGRSSEVLRFDMIAGWDAGLCVTQAARQGVRSSCRRSVEPAADWPASATGGSARWGRV